MRIVLLLLICIFKLHAVSVSYAPTDFAFSFYDEGFSYSSASERLSISASVFEAGRISSAAVGRIFDPYSPSSFSFDGIIIGDSKASLFLIASPSFAAGWHLSFYGFSISLAYTGKGDASDRLFLPVEARGGAEGVHMASLFEHEYFSVFAKLSMTESSGFDIMARASASYGGITFAWSEGTVSYLSEKRQSLRRQLELRIKGAGLDYTSSLSYGHDPFISGAYRFNEGRAKLSLEIGNITISSFHFSSFSSEGHYSQRSRYTLSYRSFTLGFTSSLALIASYDDGFFMAEYEGGAFSYGITLDMDMLLLDLVMDSRGDISIRMNLTF